MSSFSQPFILRLYVSTESDAQTIQKQLNSSDIRADYVRASTHEPSKWKVIFIDDDLTKARSTVDSLSVKPSTVEYFDPQNQAEEFKALNA